MPILRKAFSGVQAQWWLSLLVLGLVVGGCQTQRADNAAPELPLTPSGSPTPPNSRPVISPSPNFVVDVVDQVGSAVVRINASRTVSRQPNSLFGDLFGLPNQRPSERVERGTGSGFIYDKSGLVLTNRHVVEEADQVTVVLKDGRQLEGKVLGADALTDVAVIKIEADNLPTLSLGNSEAIQPGEWAIAIGNPLGLDNTVTVGIISATGRSSSEVGIPDQRVNFIQTDAAINPGNSGGPLLNQAGQVIGVNTAIISGAQGLGFAIPIDLAKDIADQLVTSGTVERAYIGVKMINLTPALVERLRRENPDLQVNSDQGVLVFEVVRDSPAEKAGLEPGDIIQSIDGKAIQDSAEVQAVVEQSKPGEVLRLQVNHEGERRNLQLTLGTLSPESFRSPG
ncbi:HhoA/HhoB/HtrA family serine endopeptidase [Lyngbya confervoides]|uniref:Trypsin-like peptidase domain-containing protein n=1 Tax=Lyngbya confervoides BDU141951 TaxID=1574623 RepID=A0ABD4T4J3_9CYAN|nr:HhoA/HhoB/HtrA family serine endopeptidase [Lyngbya confervoides]MCM1983393.1 trypsin-like peptidase domain-containing protein [Lyngbya confervoides BDU141951]